MKKLGEHLVERGWLERGDLLRALNLQRQVGGRLGTSLLEMGLVSEDELLHALGLQHNLEPADVETLRQVPEEVRALLPAKLAVRCRAVPVQATASKVHVALLDPRDLACQDELAFAIGRRLVLRAASEVRLCEALERYYGEPCGARMTRILDRLNRMRYMWEEGGSGAERTGEGRQEGRQGEEGAGTRGGGRGGAGGLAPAPLPRPAFGQPAPPPPRGRRPQPAASRTPAAHPAIQPGTPASTQPAIQTPATALPSSPTAGVAPPAADTSSGAATPAAAATPRVRPTAVTLSEHERAALYGGRAPAPLTYDDAEARLADVSGRDEAARLVVDFLRQELERVILFAVHRDATHGWTGDGDDLTPERIAAVAVPFGKPSIFLNLRQGSAFHLGPLPALPAHRPLVELLGGESPQECLLLPVRIGERMVAVLYGDRGGEHLGSIDLEALRRLADAFAHALERCILLKRQAQT